MRLVCRSSSASSGYTPLTRHSPTMTYSYSGSKKVRFSTPWKVNPGQATSCNHNSQGRRAIICPLWCVAPFMWPLSHDTSYALIRSQIDWVTLIIFFSSLSQLHNSLPQLHDHSSIVQHGPYDSTSGWNMANKLSSLSLLLPAREQIKVSCPRVIGPKVDSSLHLLLF